MNSRRSAACRSSSRAGIILISRSITISRCWPISGRSIRTSTCTAFRLRSSSISLTFLKCRVREVITKFKAAGLGSIPGGGGEILVDRVRQRISPLKCTSDEWLEVMRVAHELGLRSSATMMFGHVETLDDRLEHLRRLRDLQDETGGFTAFICWTFQPENTALRAEPVGSSEYLRMQALSRIFLDNIENLQSSWVTQGPRIGQIALKYGANDFGSVMMEENVVSSAGTTFRLNKEQIERLISRGRL